MCLNFLACGLNLVLPAWLSEKKASDGYKKAFFSAYCQKAGLCEGFLLTLAANFGNISYNMISLQNGVEENQTTDSFY